MTVILIFAKWFDDDSRIEPSGEWDGNSIKLGKNSSMTYRRRLTLGVQTYRERAADMDCTGLLKRRARKLVEKSKGGNVQVSHVSGPDLLFALFLSRHCSPV